MPDFKWTQDMPAVCTHPEIETHQRLAISMAAAAFDAIVDAKRSRPEFNGGAFVTAVNDTAHELIAAIEEALTIAGRQTGLEIDGAQRQQMIAVAARGADQLWRESQVAGVAMERYWPRFVQRFGIAAGRRPGITDPLPLPPLVECHGKLEDCVAGVGPAEGWGYCTTHGFAYPTSVELTHAGELAEGPTIASATLGTPIETFNGGVSVEPER